MKIKGITQGTILGEGTTIIKTLRVKDVKVNDVVLVPAIIKRIEGDVVVVSCPLSHNIARLVAIESVAEDLIIEELQDQLAAVKCKITTLELERNAINLRIEKEILRLCSDNRYFQK